MTENVLIFDQGQIEVFNRDYPSLKTYDVAEGYESYNRSSVRVASRVYLSHAGLTDDLAVVDVLRHRWLGKTQPLPMAVRGHTVTADRCHVYVCGGQNDMGRTMADCWRLAVRDAGPVNKTPWTSMPAMNQARKHATSATYDDNLFVFGGEDDEKSSNALATVEMLDRKTMKWEFRASMPVVRYMAACARLGKHIYVSGGMNDDGDTLTSCVRYDCKNDKWDWDTVGEMHQARHGHQMLVNKGQLMCIGGRDDDDEPLDSVEVFDPETHEWNISEHTCLNAHAQCAAVVVPGDVQTGGYGCSPM